MWYEKNAGIENYIISPKEVYKFTVTVINLINYNRLQYTSGKLKLIDLYIMKN